MLTAICIILIALTWLMYESDGLSIRLPYGKASYQDFDDNENADDTELLEANADTIPDNLASFKPSEFQPLDIPELAGELNILAKVV